MSFDHDEEKEAELERRFLEAMAAREAGRLEEAEDGLRAVIRLEPRLGEPHLELGRLLLEAGQLEDAEAHAREALTHLEATGVWVEEVAEDAVHALAHGLLAEILRQRADSDEVVFGDPAVFRALVQEARDHFRQAASLDPTDETSAYHGFFLGTGLGGTEWRPDAGEA